MIMTISLKIICEYMDKVSEAPRDVPLPYINLLTNIIEYINIPLESGECAELTDTIIN